MHRRKHPPTVVLAVLTHNNEKETRKEAGVFDRGYQKALANFNRVKQRNTCASNLHFQL